MLPSLVLQRSSVPPYQRGFYCSDAALRYPYKGSTVPTATLTAVGLALPVVSVSHPHSRTPRRDPGGPSSPASGGGRGGEGGG